MTQLADALRALRDRSGMGQEQLADLLGVRQQTVSRWEHGAALPRPTRIVALAGALGVEPAVLHRLAGYLPDGSAEGLAERDRMREWVTSLDQQALVLLVDVAWNELLARDATESSG